MIKKVSLLLAIAFLFSCEKEKVEDVQEEKIENIQNEKSVSEKDKNTDDKGEVVEEKPTEQGEETSTDWKLVSIIQDGMDFTSDCDKQNTINLETESEVTQVFFDSNESGCFQLSSVTATYNQTSNKFENPKEDFFGTIEIKDNMLQVKFSGSLSGTVVTYSK